MTQLHRAKARHFHALHHDGSVLTLATAWDVASARLVEQAGGQAVATTSTGVARRLGAADGDLAARERVLRLTAAVVAAVDVPVTTDIESGFAADPAGVRDTVRRALAAGAVGVTIEDVGYSTASGLRPIGEQVRRIAAARAAADAVDVPLFVNARIDMYPRAAGPAERRLAATLARAAAYLASGADGIFVPGVADPATIAALVAEISAPLSILADHGTPSIAQLAELGVARVSIGSTLAEATYALIPHVVGT
jgi:2-methylisocitrate lyase-like PEP mutase family enzyme